ncbi:hypothetical protein H6S15_20375 [Escherichia coli]|nr:hypothetical protein H6S15_20375 [Escherichia coli]
MRQNFRIFQNGTSKHPRHDIAGKRGDRMEPRCSASHPSREFCVQYGETDYDFLCRMAAEEGIFFYEEHAKVPTRALLCDTVAICRIFEIPWNPNTRTEVSTLCISQFATAHKSALLPW